MSDSTRNPADYARMVPAQPSTVADTLPRPRPIGITSFPSSYGERVFVLYDDGSVWKHTYDGWTRLPPIPTGDRP